MIEGLPRYVATRLGDRPDAYLADGPLLKPLTRIDGPAEGAHAVAPARLPDGFAGMSEVIETIARVEKVHASVCPGGGVVVALVAGLDEAILEMRRREADRLKVSAA